MKKLEQVKQHARRFECNFCTAIYWSDEYSRYKSMADYYFLEDNCVNCKRTIKTIDEELKTNV